MYTLKHTLLHGLLLATLLCVPAIGMASDGVYSLGRADRLSTNGIPYGIYYGRPYYYAPYYYYYPYRPYYYHYYYYPYRPYHFYYGW